MMREAELNVCRGKVCLSNGSCAAVATAALKAHSLDAELHKILVSAYETI